MAKNRILYLDVLRCLACLMVVLMHSPQPGVVADAYLLSSVSFLTAPGVGLFFMVSGALLLPVGDDAPHFLKHRMAKIVFPTLFWTLVSLLVFTGCNSSHLSWVRSVCSVPFSVQGHGVLWFMYVLAGLYLLAPVLSPWLRQASRSELKLVLSLWGITLCFPMLKVFLSVNQGITGSFYYFSGYAGYFLLGHYMHRYRPRLSWPWVLFLLLLPLAVAAVCKLASLEVDFYEVFWYLSLWVVMMCAAWFLLCRRFFSCLPAPSLPSRLLVNFSKCSFGIYLVHIFVMRKCLWQCSLFQNSGGG